MLGVGQVGELEIGGGGVGRGYLNNAAETALKFVPAEGGESGERAYRSGDRVRWQASGELEYLGRGDGQVKVRGYRVELGEIEAVLQAEAGGEQGVGAVRGEGGEQRRVGYIVERGGSGEGLSEAELRERLRRRLPEYMVPR